MNSATNLPTLRRSVAFIVLFTVLFAGILGIESWRYHSGVFPNAGLLLAGETNLVLHGTGTQQREVLPVYPPLLFFLFLVLRNPVVVAALVSAFVVSYMLYFVGVNFQSVGLKSSMWLILLTASVLLSVDEKEIQLYMFLFLFALSNYLLLEFYRRDYAFYLFGFGLSLAVMYLILPEIVVFLLVVVPGFLLMFGLKRRTVTYLFVALFPVLFAVAMRQLISLILSGSFTPLLPGLGTSAPRGPVVRQLAVVSVPYVAALGYFVFRAGRYREFYSSPIFIALLSPLVFLVLSSLLVGTAISPLALSPVYVLNLAMLFPYMSLLLPERASRVPLSLILIAGAILNVIVFVTSTSVSAAPNVENYQRMAGAIASSGEISLPADAAAILYFIPRDRLKDVVYVNGTSTSNLSTSNLSTSAPATVIAAVDPTRASSVPEGYRETFRTGAFVVAVRQ